MSGQHKPFSPDSSVEVQRLEMALEAAGVGTWELDLSNNTVRWCERTKALYGFSGDDIVPYKDVVAIIHPDDRVRVDNSVKTAIDGKIKSSYNIEFRVTGNTDEQTRWLLCKGLAYFDADDNPVKFLGTAQNVTHNVQNRQQLKENEENIRSLVDNTPDVITRWSKDLKLLFANTAFEEKTGTPNALSLGKNNKEMGHSDSFSDPYMHCLNQVFKTGKQQDHYNSFLTPNGEIFYYSRLVPEFDEQGNVQSVLAIARDISEMKATEARFQTMVEQSPMAIGLLRGKDMVIEVGNDRIFEVWGKDKSITGKPLMEALPEIKNQVFMELLSDVYETGNPYYGNSVMAKLVRNGKLQDAYFDFAYTPLRDKTNTISGVMVLAIEVTGQVIARQEIETSEARFRLLVEEAPVATSLFIGRDLIIEIANDTMLGYWGADHKAIGKKLSDAVPELLGQPFLQILDDVYTSGITYEAQNTAAILASNGILGTYYFDFTYKPLRNHEGEVYAIMEIAVDVTSKVLAMKALEESESKLRSVIEAAPAGMVVFTGEDMIVEMPNQAFIDIIGKGSDIAGKPLRDVMPELQNQAFLKILDNVYTSGQMYRSDATLVEIVKHGVMTRNLYDFTYTPLLDSDGKVFAILDISVDVTESVKARQNLEQAEESLRDAVELAELGTWLVDPISNFVTFSDRMNNWFGGNTEHMVLEESLEYIDEEDRGKVKNGITEALNPASNGYFSEEYVITNKITGQRRILQARGRAFFTEDGKPYLMRGTAQDVTEQRLLQINLEQQVQERTEELEVTNEELASINEEYMATNEELAESNYLLTQSNQNLQQFAYIASHDLQEPLRKIQSFGNLLSSRYNKDLGEGVNLIERMQTAANRMSVLIQDLLTFSRISTKQDSTQPVVLSTVVESVLSDLELIIHETKANIEVAPLPSILGDESQLGQLFLNLISNALKFKNSDVTPEIKINLTVLNNAHLPANVKPARAAAEYYRIDVSDNGIGFDQKYADRIFQVFQRLHGRSEFAGTGIGLAICEKVATNHGGAISATSQVGKGATFSVFLPV